MFYLISKDPGTKKNVADFLGSGQKLKSFDKVKAALSAVRSDQPRLIILDADIEENKGLQNYKSIRQIDPGLPVIMISSSSDFQLVVAATKLGIKDFLRKPLEKEKLAAAVGEALKIKQAPPALRGIEDIPWLAGNSAPLLSLFRNIEAVLEEPVDIALVGEAGCDKKAVADLINKNSRGAGVFKSLKLSSFGRDTDEAYFWVTIQGLLSIKERVEKETRLTTLYSSGFSEINPLFKDSLLGFIEKRRKSKKKCN